MVFVLNKRDNVQFFGVFVEDIYNIFFKRNKYLNNMSDIYKIIINLAEY